MNIVNPKLQARFKTLKASGHLPSPKGPSPAGRLLKLANACHGPDSLCDIMLHWLPWCITAE